MKSKWFVVGILIVVLIGLCGASLFATWQGVKMAQEAGVHINLANWSVEQVNAKATEEKTLEVSSPVNLSVETYQGNITVSAGKDGQVAVKVEKTAWGSSDADAQAALKDIKLVVDQHGNTIKISIDQSVEVDMLHIGPRGGRADFTITVPASTAVTLNSSLGNLALSGASGNAKLDTTSGSIDITDVAGEINVHSNDGEITAKNIGAGGMLTLSSEFGAISVDGAKGSDVTISSSNGDLGLLKDIHATGLLKVTSEFGAIDMTGGQAKTAEVRSNNGAVKLESITVDGSITVKSDFGSLTMRAVNAGSYDLTTQNGKISLDGAQNAVKVHSDFGGIEVLNARNATIDLSSNNGAIAFTGSLGAGPHTVSSDFGNISVTLPASAALNVEMQTDFGKIKSDFSITISGIIDSKHWKGIINGGGVVLTVKTNNGNITLQRSSK
jgi:DUF4097 and DUF4098 domain-containing protein YvlB